MLVAVGTVKGVGSDPKQDRDGNAYDRPYVRVRLDDEADSRKVVLGRQFGDLPEQGDSFCAEVTLFGWQQADGTRGVLVTALRSIDPKVLLAEVSTPARSA